MAILPGAGLSQLGNGSAKHGFRIVVQWRLVLAGAEGETLAEAQARFLRDPDAGKFQAADLETDLGGGTYDDLGMGLDGQYARDRIAKALTGAGLVGQTYQPGIDVPGIADRTCFHDLAALVEFEQLPNGGFAVQM